MFQDNPKMSLHSRRPVTPPSDPLDIRWPSVELTTSAYNQQSTLEYTWSLGQSHQIRWIKPVCKTGQVSKLQNWQGSNCFRVKEDSDAPTLFREAHLHPNTFLQIVKKSLWAPRFYTIMQPISRMFIWHIWPLLQNSAFQPSRGRLLFIHTVGQLVGWSSRFVTINSISMKPSVKIRNQTYYIYGESLWCWQSLGTC